MKKRILDETFRQMALDLADPKGSLGEATQERGIDSGRVVRVLPMVLLN